MDIAELTTTQFTELLVKRMRHIRLRERAAAKQALEYWPLSATPTYLPRGSKPAEPALIPAKGLGRVLEQALLPLKDQFRDGDNGLQEFLRRPELTSPRRTANDYWADQLLYSSAEKQDMMRFADFLRTDMINLHAMGPYLLTCLNGYEAWLEFVLDALTVPKPVPWSMFDILAVPDRRILIEIISRVHKLAIQSCMANPHRPNEFGMDYTALLEGGRGRAFDRHDHFNRVLPLIAHLSKLTEWLDNAKKAWRQR